MTIQIPVVRPGKYWIPCGIAVWLFVGTASALAFGLSDSDYQYLATQNVERTSSLIIQLSPKEQARLHSLINDPRTAKDPDSRDKNVHEVLAEYLGHQLWEKSHPGLLWDASK